MSAAGAALVAAKDPSNSAGQPHSTTSDTERLAAELGEAARKAGLQPDDPMTPLVHALIKTIRYLGQRTDQSDRIASQASKRIAGAIFNSRQAAEAELNRIHAELAKAEADTVARIATAIAETADVALTNRIRLFDRNSALCAATVLFAVAIASFAIGEFSGRSHAEASVHETEEGLKAAFLDGPDTARAWRELMAWNSLRASLNACKTAPDRIRIQDGRRWCPVPFWIEKPINPPPQL